MTDIRAGRVSTRRWFHTALTASLAFVLLLATACAGADRPRAAIVVTTNILGDVTRNIVGDEAEVTVLMKPDADPHSFGISAQQAAEIEQAGLVVYNGLGLEEGVLRNVEAAEEASVPTLAVGEQADPLNYTSDESAGQPDPHFWTDPRRVGDAVETIADAVIAHVDGVDEAAVRQNAENYRAEIDELDAAMNAAFERIPAEDRKLVTNHHVFGYLAERFDFEVVGAVIPSGTTLASPSASDLASLADTIHAAGVPAIFADSSQPDRLAQVLADQAGVDVAVIPLFSESLSAVDQGAATYLEMMRSNTEAISDGLLGEY
ncbi:MULTISPECIES: zinc ABC transporter substrate-binding protein AztC [Actinoalloteichus]|uniref:ABC-type metal ion transport system, periplasmic component/surface adhesin n=1 Tax=Actinoalloteichus fjordicus TaxID=1612552 RepID=A0AAC9LDP2_9PSEU|nr:MULTISPECIES: zinc ABC transporter substrate-binding protein AztC [Actinoalloteichus]APU15943.1 ABC-type metal ion transport system, periplasmic component/surface adhesin [Actinoalloteichus fjordicus]APU22006.1 ABC-type metal ion transport system, periplasmic component/surface adhesin [Actinoalloteichus sp. GBA129-24]